jgi:hypothetical protein
MNIIEQADLQVKEAEKTYYQALDLAAEILGYSHPRDPRRVVELKPAKESTARA